MYNPEGKICPNGWGLASTLTTGNQVLTKSGHTTVTSVKKQVGSQKVYNLEVRDLHNFLVGEFGVVVHNDCMSGKKKLCPPARIKEYITESKFKSWILKLKKRPIKGDSSAKWYKYQKRVAGDFEVEVKVPSSNKTIWADGYDAASNALVEAKLTGPNKTFDLNKYKMFEDMPGSVMPWEKNIFESLDDEMAKYAKIVKHSSNNITELHVKISVDKVESRALFLYLGGKYDFPLKVIYEP